MKIRNEFYYLLYYYFTYDFREKHYFKIAFISHRKVWKSLNRWELKKKLVFKTDLIKIVIAVSELNLLVLAMSFGVLDIVELSILPKKLCIK